LIASKVLNFGKEVHMFEAAASPSLKNLGLKYPTVENNEKARFSQMRKLLTTAEE
jgi:hypothetical protein